MTKRILVIDDDEGTRSIIRLSLEAIAGWQVMTAGSGQAGIAAAIAEQPDAILLDKMMPDLDGAMVFQQLQANALTQNIPTILLTATARSLGSAEEQNTLLELGLAGIIQKPFKPKSLVEAIVSLLEWSI